MEVLRKISLVLFLVIVFLFVGASIYLQRNGKSLLEKRLAAVLQKEVHFGKARLLFPLGLRFDNIEVKEMLTAKVLRIHFGVPVFFGGHFNIAKIKLTEPVFFVTFSGERKITLGTSIQPQSSPAALDAVPATAKDKDKAAAKVNVFQGIIIDYLEIKNGQVKIFDQVHNNNIDIGQINLKAMEVPLPARNIKTRFDFTAIVISENIPFAGQKVEARGMINVTARNMDATLKMVDASGNIGFSAHLKSINNDMIVKGKINVGRFVSGIKTKDSQESSFEGFLASALESSGVEIGVDFTCQTKMDDFNCDKLGMSGKVVQNEKAP